MQRIDTSRRRRSAGDGPVRGHRQRAALHSIRTPSAPRITTFAPSFGQALPTLDTVPPASATETVSASASEEEEENDSGPVIFADMVLVLLENRFPCLEIRHGGVMAHVAVRVGENFIESVITRRSAEEMSLKQGNVVKVVIKSTEVMLQKD
jgi:molybdopterin-binding protein